jgi:hypothetical protein
LALNFQLQESTNLSLTNGWSTVDESRSTNNGFISVATSDEQRQIISLEVALKL